MVLPAYAAPARHRVLVVDDHPDVLVLLAGMLENAGFDVEEASSGRAAIELATNGQPFDVVVLDVNMGDVDGARVAAEIRACERCKRTRIVFHTVVDEYKIRNRFADYDDFLRKPFDCDLMVERITQLAENLRVPNSGHRDMSRD